jgi:hypothetical protein
MQLLQLEHNRHYRTLFQAVPVQCDSRSKNGCGRIGGDGHPRAPYSSAILPGQRRVVFGNLRTPSRRYAPRNPAIPDGHFPPFALVCAVRPRKPVIDVRSCPHHRTPDEQRHDNRGDHERPDAKTWQSHGRAPLATKGSPRSIPRASLILNSPASLRPAYGMVQASGRRRRPAK